MDIDFVLTGQRIREARKFRGWTADVLAEKVGLATESLRHIENASGNILCMEHQLGFIRNRKE